MLFLGSSSMLMGKMLSCTTHQVQYGQSSCTLGNLFIPAHGRLSVASKSAFPSCPHTLLPMIFHRIDAGF